MFKFYVLLPTTSDRILKCHWQVMNALWDASDDSKDQIEHTQNINRTFKALVCDSAWKVCWGEKSSRKKLEIRNKKRGRQRRIKSIHVAQMSLTLQQKSWLSL
jgi:hypothetical protein